MCANWNDFCLHVHRNNVLNRLHCWWLCCYRWSVVEITQDRNPARIENCKKTWPWPFATTKSGTVQYLGLTMLPIYVASTVSSYKMMILYAISRIACILAQLWIHKISWLALLVSAGVPCFAACCAAVRHAMLWCSRHKSWCKIVCSYFDLLRAHVGNLHAWNLPLTGGVEDICLKLDKPVIKYLGPETDSGEIVPPTDILNLFVK